MKNAWGTTVEILHVPKVRIVLMIGKHAVVENVLTLASTWDAVTANMENVPMYNQVETAYSMMTQNALMDGNVLSHNVVIYVGINPVLQTKTAIKMTDSVIDHSKILYKNQILNTENKNIFSLINY